MVNGSVIKKQKNSTIIEINLSGLDFIKTPRFLINLPQHFYKILLSRYGCKHIINQQKYKCKVNREKAACKAVMIKKVTARGERLP